MRTVLSVSVVVPTYRSGPELDDLVASLDRQTLPPERFEAIFVDDGSPDRTYDRLRRLAAARPYMRVERIPHSGWPSRPRNVGTDMARGEYVAYLDHDDELYPDALRAAHEFATRHGADVVNGKEVRVGDPGWALSTYRADEGQVTGIRENPLLPMNPHKLYRREFLDRHGIRFPEGGRVMWEDILFNVQVQRHARVIATLASVPYYRWNRTPGSESEGFVRSAPPYWQGLRDVFAAIDDTFNGEQWASQRDPLVLHQYRSRVLAAFDGRLVRRGPIVRDLVYGEGRALQAAYVDEALDSRLGSSNRLRAHLLRAGERDLLEALPLHDPVLPPSARATAVAWEWRLLRISLRVDWADAAGRHPALERRGDRILKVLPAGYEAAVPDDLRDVTDELAQARVYLGLRSQESDLVWMLPEAYPVEVSGENRDLRVGANIEAEIDVDHAVFGDPLGAGAWDVTARFSVGDAAFHSDVRSHCAPTAVVDGDDILVASSTEGRLSIAMGPDEGRAVRLFRPDVRRVAIAAGPVVRVRVPLPGVEVARAGTVHTSMCALPGGPLGRILRLGRPSTVPARIVADGEGAWLTADLPAPVDRLRVGDLVAGGGWWVLDARHTTSPRLAAWHAPGADMDLARLVRGARRRIRTVARRGLGRLRRGLERVRRRLRRIVARR